MQAGAKLYFNFAYDAITGTGSFVLIDKSTLRIQSILSHFCLRGIHRQPRQGQNCVLIFASDPFTGIGRLKN